MPKFATIPDAVPASVALIDVAARRMRIWPGPKVGLSVSMTVGVVPASAMTVVFTVMGFFLTFRS
jgi:hypothetical protein